MRRLRACALAWSVAACAAPSAPPPPSGSTTTTVKGRFVGSTVTPASTVRVLDCRNIPGSERVRKDGSFELVALDCAPGVHRLVFGKDNAGLLKFVIRGRSVDIGTIEGGQ